jgi:hypothetical protein
MKAYIIFFLFHFNTMSLNRKCELQDLEILGKHVNIVMDMLQPKLHIIFSSANRFLCAPK